ncbi:MAG TPA: GH1 family beta-glucosidase [Phototrophicaceae bacterium]|nr:GH1 family beta-glucosidase [Phototrophicaceae bacterium]
MAPLKFPADFTWGTATASYQIEGAAHEDGRGVSIWDMFSHTPGKVKNGDTGDVADDHYHRWRDDIQLMKALNISAYRLSIAWPRILPSGRGAVNELGLEFYDRLIDELLANEITPYVTLYHWDLPQPLQDEGGWMRRGITDDFVNYVDVVSRALGDRVKNWITFNEPWVFTWLGYVIGVHAPGLTSATPEPAFITSHNCYLAHGLSVPVIRSNSKDAQVGITLNLSPADPATSKPADLEATAIYDGWFNRWYLDPLYRKQYPADIVQTYEPFMPKIEPGDMDIIAAPLDFLGINYYSRAVIEASGDASRPFQNVRPEGEYTAMDWEVYPLALYNILMRIHSDYNPGALYVTENGAAYEDTLTPDGKVHDPQRTAYYQSHLEACQHAIEDGVPLKGYFAWSLLDNFEWGEGYAKRFGLHYVDYTNQKRYRKDSGDYYAQVASGKA